MGESRRTRSEPAKEAQLERELAEARAEADRLRQEWDGFWRVVRHELFTPLHNIMGYAALLGSSGLPPVKAQEYLSVIVRETDRVTAVVEALGVQTDLRRGALSFTPAAVELPELVMDMARAREAVERDLVVLVHVPKRLPPTCVDAFRVRYVLESLLRHAARLLPSGGVIDVILAHRRAAGQVEIAVRVRRAFMPAADRNLIFAPFGQAPSGPAHLGRAREPGRKPVQGPALRTVEGAVEGNARPPLGLGLHAAREVARRLGGDLALEGRRKRGVAFVLRLPAAEGSDDRRTDRRR